MEKFTRLTAVAAPLLVPNIDTDVIIRIERMFEMRRDQLGPYAFEAWRFRPDGSENPEFVLNRSPFREARILLAGPNFGCGSSRESAVWALQGFGIRSVIAPSYGDIFFGNCFQNGILPIVLPEPVVASLAAEASADPARLRPTIDLEACVVISPAGHSHPFAVDSLRREGLLQGLDGVGLTLLRRAEILSFQAADRNERPWVWQTDG